MNRAVEHGRESRVSASAGDPVHAEVEACGKKTVTKLVAEVLRKAVTKLVAEGLMKAVTKGNCSLQSRQTRTFRDWPDAAIV